ncbi:MAG: 16S rRNA (guanine(966)-N(2))-methyltransferase RsmD, partial [Clostridia bacterium]|nr:16S rRNA (guanine(966)-N(2))-methyltransferase RsmD [Clostridia bacterium]
MRVIAGKYKGRRLKSPSGRGTRPTKDKVKEAIFNVLGSEIIEKNVLEAFAGTGGLGIEALSRGAHHVTFIDKNYTAIKAIKK